MKHIYSILIGTLLFIYQVIPVSAQKISIDLNKEYQTIRGYGGVNMPGWIDDLSENLVDKAFGNNPGQLGLSILRVRVPNSSSEFYREIPVAILAKKYGAIILGSPWSPPASLKSNNNTTGGELLPANYEKYADHLLAFAQFMKNNAAPLYAISIQNEPDIKVSYESCDWTVQQMTSFIKQQGTRFDTLKLVASESFNFNRKMTDPILLDTAAVKHVDIMGGHLYGGGLADYPLARQKGKDIWMTEHLTGSDNEAQNTWALALSMGSEINNCMKANFNAYIWWYIRRFYSLLNDAGNITDKGYVMSHFSKFIRPGSVRVDALVSSAYSVDATAYKTDTSLVIIVINKRTTSVPISFSIQNRLISKLIQFTSTSIMKVENQGEMLVVDGSFSATLPPSSITTFTSYGGNAGKQNNIRPIANAGDAITITDLDGDGEEKIMLDGSNSNDPDGTIANYSWSLNGIQIASTPSYEFTADIGNYTIMLTVTDNDGATNVNSIQVKIDKIATIFKTDLWLEAECGNVGSNWLNLEDPTASNNRYVVATPGIESVGSMSLFPKYQIQFKFHVDEAANYVLWARVITPTANDDSYWLKMNSGATVAWNNIPLGNDWHWVDARNASDQTIKYYLGVGDHTLILGLREDGAMLDKLLLTNTGLVPTDMGDESFNCTGDTTAVSDYALSGAVSLYPNPATDQVNISWIAGFSSVKIYTTDGRFVYMEEFQNSMKKTKLDLNIQPGNYLLLLQNGTDSAVKKLTVK